MRMPWLLVALAAGCGNDTALSGLYMIDAWDASGATCADAGTSLLGAEGDTVFYVKWESFFGAEFVNVKACEDRATCEAEASDGDTIHLSTNFGQFEHGSDEDGWTQETLYALSNEAMPGQCFGGGTRSRLTADGETAVAIRIESFSFTFPEIDDPEDRCPIEEAQAAAVGVPCEELVTVHGTQIGEI